MPPYVMSFKPPVMNSFFTVREGTAVLLFGAGWKGCWFLLSVFCFSGVPLLFVLVVLMLFIILPATLQSFVARLH
jgi:hypothetical protein